MNLKEIRESIPEKYSNRDDAIFLDNEFVIEAIQRETALAVIEEIKSFLEVDESLPYRASNDYDNLYHKLTELKKEVGG